MPSPCLVDNDVVLKAAAFKLGSAMVSALSQGAEPPAMLGVGRFVVRQKSRKGQRFQEPERVAAEVDALFEELQFVEPTDQEIEHAAILEEAASRSGNAFDVGEAQLFAILLQRGSRALITGDKRAIKAASQLSLDEANGKILCLEQLLILLLSVFPVTELRSKICAEPLVDSASTNCFACSTFDIIALDLRAAIDGLSSYVADLRRGSGDLLMEEGDVSALPS